MDESIPALGLTHSFAAFTALDASCVRPLCRGRCAAISLSVVRRITNELLMWGPGNFPARGSPGPFPLLANGQAQAALRARDGDKKCAAFLLSITPKGLVLNSKKYHNVEL